MNYEQTLEFLYTKLPQFSRIGAAAYKKDLHNIKRLCEALGNPQQHFKAIHVAGTNGKGSTSHMLSAVLQSAGYKTGLYTSPHIFNFEERIKINGKEIDRDFIIDFVNKIKPLCQEIKCSFFELTVAMAFEYFALHEVDLAIVETGLGGRLDSTNIIIPILSVITNIGLDHTDMLGDTLTAIAEEKAGIIKKNIPVVVGEINPETLPVFKRRSAEMESILTLAPEKYMVQYIDPYNNLLLCNLKQTDTDIVKKLRLDLTGLYQVKNVCTVLTAIEVLRKDHYTIPEEAIQEGLENVKKLTGLRGRWDVIHHKPEVIIDVAHNAEGIKEILTQLDLHYPARKLHFVIGFVKDKNLENILNILPPSHNYYITNAHIPRALPFTELLNMAKEHTLDAYGFDNVNVAVREAMMMAGETDVVIICGSFYLIGELDLSLFQEN